MTFSRPVRTIASLALLTLLASASGCVPEPTDESDSIESELVAEAPQALGGHPGGESDVLLLQDEAHGAKSYESLTQGWLEWGMGLPWSTGPITDPTGEQCGLGQSGPVWYLAGTPGGAVTRDCDIPPNRLLYFPLLNHWMIPPPQFVDTPEELADFIAFAEWYFPANRGETCSLTLRLDGEDVLAGYAELDQELWIEILDPFPITINDDNYAGFPGGDKPAALTAGHYALLRPLSPGDHTLELGGTQCDPVNGTYFETAAVYHLHVAEGD